MQFKTQYDEHPRVFADSGSPVKVVYQANYDGSGILRVNAVGEEDLYGYIQSHKDSVDIHVILKRFAAGEVDVLSQMQGFYADVADMPSTYAEILNAVLEGERVFAGLPIEVKNEFGNSFAQWLAAMDQDNFQERMDRAAHPEKQVAPSQVQDFAVPAPAPASAVTTGGDSV